MHACLNRNHSENRDCPTRRQPATLCETRCQKKPTLCPDWLPAHSECGGPPAVPKSNNPLLSPQLQSTASIPPKPLHRFQKKVRQTQSPTNPHFPPGIQNCVRNAKSWDPCCEGRGCTPRHRRGLDDRRWSRATLMPNGGRGMRKAGGRPHASARSTG